MNITVLNLANWERFVILETQKTTVIIINKGSFLMKYFETAAFPWQLQYYMHTASLVPTVTRYYSTFLIHWMCKTFNFPATTEAGPGGEKGEEESRGAKRHLTAFITRARCALWLASQSPNQVPLHPVVENTIGWWGKELCAKPTPLLTLALQKPS